ncbi:hypothetical protein [Flavonifractor phage Chenonceau]|nr:hypothetical protein [Flavonifractor phage Chenonceau]DAL91108.1 MAG TPA: hypothetical protein [Caudoviricetes sp.]
MVAHAFSFGKHRFCGFYTNILRVAPVTARKECNHVRH